MFFVSSASYAWMSNSDVGTCGAQFLKIGIGARPMGMGGATTARSGVESLYWNPAGVASLSSRKVLLQHTQWFEDTSIEYLGAAVPAGKSVIGLSMTYLAISDFEGRTSDTSSPDYYFDANDSAVGITWAKAGSSIDSGLTIKALKSNIGSDSSNVALAADVGFIKKGLSLSGYPSSVSLVLKDFGTKVKFNTQQDNLPSVIKLGLATEFSKQLNMTADLNLPRDNEVNLAVGLEYFLPVTAVKFPLRIGYKTLNDFETIDGFSAGFGLGVGSYDLDFAWVPYGDFSDTYRISLTGKF